MCSHIYHGNWFQKWFFPYDYQEIERREKINVNDVTPEEAKSYALQQPKHTGFAFDSPGYESFFASQLAVYKPQKAWDVGRRASTKSHSKMPPEN
ncbi:hypothetical protein HAX54_052956 [Datura stramonium]|uniref:Uncharacterized protein n=1 Tax=Datura stramonium TaxID=4076 RepID=A0ABS8SZP1_DATST|nr:hypothetical protein [Datura stramonium]